MIRLLAIIALAGALAWLQWRLAAARLDRAIRRASHPLRDPGLEAHCARLAEAAGAERIEPRLFDMPAVNGLAAPDGAVYLSTGLMEKVRAGLVTREEAAGVVAHEMGHVALGHHRRRLIDLTGSAAARMALGVALNRVVPIFGAALANLIGNAFMARLSRRDEAEADRYAAALMIRAGFGVGPQVSLLRKLRSMAAGQAEPPLWLATHPEIDRRIAAIEADAAHWDETG